MTRQRAEMRARGQELVDGERILKFGCTQVELRSSHRYEVLVGNWKCMARVGREVSARN